MVRGGLGDVPKLELYCPDEKVRTRDVPLATGNTLDFNM